MLSIISLVVVIASVTFFGLSTWLLATWQMAELDGAFTLTGCLIAAILLRSASLIPLISSRSRLWLPWSRRRR
jgi:hypothetical protein